jgi:hypothetical protein
MAKTLKSALSGVWLMQTIRMTVPAPCKIQYTVRHKGDGNNRLRVRYGSFQNVIWGKVNDFDLEPGKSASRSVVENDDDTGAEDAQQDIRWRLSPAVLTMAIDRELTYTVTRLNDESDATAECHTTVTNEKYPRQAAVISHHPVRRRT